MVFWNGFIQRVKQAISRKEFQALENKVAKNSDKIKVNSEDIEINANNITFLVKQDANLQKEIEQNKKDIAKNKTNIATNKQDIVDLTQRVQTNETNIADNRKEIEANQFNINALINQKAEKTDVYTKAEIDTQQRAQDNLINQKANSNDVYTKNEVYTKVESDAKFELKGQGGAVKITKIDGTAGTLINGKGGPTGKLNFWYVDFRAGGIESNKIISVNMVAKQWDHNMFFVGGFSKNAYPVVGLVREGATGWKVSCVVEDNNWWNSHRGKFEVVISHT